MISVDLLWSSIQSAIVLFMFAPIVVNQWQPRQPSKFYVQEKEGTQSLRFAQAIGANAGGKLFKGAFSPDPSSLKQELLHTSSFIESDVI